MYRAGYRALALARTRFRDLVALVLKRAGKAKRTYEILNAVPMAGVAFPPIRRKDPS